MLRPVDRAQQDDLVAGEQADRRAEDGRGMAQFTGAGESVSGCPARRALKIAA
jgi:hypothetical protein